jgi:Rrf2 family cysteine metabolism transcriptional repressor
MKITSRERSGLLAMAELADRYGEGPIPLNQVAEAQGVSLEYLEQIMPSLRDAGLVYSTRGARGGYELCCAPAQITVGQVLYALDGEILPLNCIIEDATCERSPTCSVRTVWQTIHDRIQDTLDSMTLADL